MAKTFRRIVLWLVYLLAWVTVYIHAQTQSACYDDCPLMDICSNASVIEEITGKTRTVTIPCEVTQMERPGHEAVNITQGPNVNQTCGSNPELDRYVFGHDHSTLRVNCLEPGDEGLYRCRDGMEYCPLITNFLTCPRRVNPTDCEETVYVEEGQPIIFDTRLMYDTGSVCQCNQRISNYRFFNDGVDYSCHDPGNCTSRLGNITNYREPLDNSYNFSLQLNSPKPANGTTFTFQIVGVYPPGIEGVYTITKIFTLLFKPSAPTMTEQSTVLTTNAPTTTKPTRNGGSEMLSAAIGGGIAAAVTSVAIVLSVVAVLLCCRYHRAHPNRLGEHKNKNLETNYTEVNDNIYTI